MAELVTEFLHHSNDINGCCFSPSSKLLASCSSDKSVRVYDVDLKQELDGKSPLQGHGLQVTCCCFSPFGTILASGSHDCNIILWDTTTWEKLAILKGHSGGVLNCVFSGDSKLLATASADETVCLWNVKTFRLFTCLKGNESPVTTCKFTTDNLHIISGTSEGVLEVWDVQTGVCKALVAAHDCGLSGIGVTGCDLPPPDSPILTSTTNGEAPHTVAASCGGDNNVILWDLYTASAYSDKCHFKKRAILQGHQGPVNCCQFNPKGDCLVSCSFDKSIILWNPLTAELITTINAHARYVTSVCFSPNGKFLASGSNDRKVNLYRLKDTERHAADDEAKGEAVRQHVDWLEEQRNQLKRLSSWTINDVSSFLKKIGLEQYVEIFAKNAIDGRELANLNDVQLQNNLFVAALGHRNKIQREVKGIKAMELDTVVPDEFVCPISREIMIDPVLASDGYSYDRFSIQSWIDAGRKTSPMTNSPLVSTSITPNRSLRMAITRFFGENGMSFA